MTRNPNIRVRFAPSPTGYLHVGGLRTALYNFLFARQQNGTFILRIEDTDRTRFVQGAMENLIETLQWAGLAFDEGPGKEGDVGPYIQSERLSIYKEHVQKLLEGGKAYRCFCTPERLEEMRKQQEKLRIPPKYDRRCLKLSKQEIDEQLARGTAHVIRMKIPEASVVAFHDIIRENVEFATDRLDDQVLLKSDGYPTYHLANVVDDHLMKISHVIRGEEWLSSTPKHVLLYQYFGWEIPIFAHLPLLLNHDRSKLSKRQGDVAVEEYKAKGYLREGLINFVALLGWNPGDEREIFSMDELIKEFSLDRVGKSGAVFNVEKLAWINQQHVRQTDDAVLVTMVKPDLDNAGFQNVSDEYVSKVIHLMKDRVTLARDFVNNATYFWRDPVTFDETAQKKSWTAESGHHLAVLLNMLEADNKFTTETIEASLRKVAETNNVSAGKIIHAVRLALTGIPVGPGLFELMVVLGRETTVRRLKKAVEILNKKIL